RRPSTTVSASVTRSSPPVVRNVVSSTHVPRRYRRAHAYGPRGRIENEPPAAGSRIAAKIEGELASGRQSQSIEPSREARAAVRQSPIRPKSPMGGCVAASRDDVRMGPDGSAFPCPCPRRDECL